MGPGITRADLKIIRDLGIFSQVRGMDGAGVYQIRSNAQKGWRSYEQLYKTYATFSEMVLEIETKQRRRDKGMEDILDTISIDIFMGHVRWATKGGTDSAQAHPYAYSTLVGAHNGTLRDKKYEDNVRTDSDLMFEDANRRGLETVLNELDPWSAYAITVYDKVQKRMYFARNDDRPLFFAVNKNRSVLYWASEKKMLEYVLDRNNELSNCSLHELISGLLVYVDPTEMTYRVIQDKPKTIFHGRELHPKKKNTHYAGNHKNHTDVDDYWSNWTKKKFEKKEEEVKVVEVQAEVDDNVVPFSGGTKITSSLRSYHAACECGKQRLNLLQISQAIRGKSQQFKSNTEGDKFFCMACTNDSNRNDDNNSQTVMA
jgi:glucosamine 6-phosphate synthetase-like amidotransferase/phosphosugar isomerase protein